MSTLTKPAAIYWDWDGTLADSYSFLNDAHNHTLVKLGFAPFKDGEYKQYFGKPREILYPAIYKEKCDDAMNIFQDYVFKNSHNVPLIDHSRDVLDFLKEQKTPMGIVSNKKGSFIAKELKHLKLDSHFDVLVGSGEAANDKPSHAPLILALEQAGHTHHAMDDIWFVGDTENDLLCAKNAGCRALFLTGHANTNTLIELYKPDFCFDNYRELKEFLVAIY